MKNIIIATIFFLIYGFAISQENKFSLGLVGSYDKYSAQPITSFGESNNYETTLAFGLGLNFQYNFNEKLFLRSGLHYAKKGYKVDYNFTFIDANDPFIPKESNLKIHGIGIPVIMGYYLKNGTKFKVSSSIGFINEIVIKIAETSTYEDNSTRDSKNLSNELPKFFLSTQFNIGVEYHINEKIYFNIEPYFRYGFNKIGDNLMEFNPISYGGLIGLNYKF